MRIENCTAQICKHMAGTGESLVGENVTVELKETVQPVARQGAAVVETVKCQGESSKQSSRPRQIHTTVKTTVMDKTIKIKKQSNDVTKQFSDLHLGSVPKTNTKIKNTFHQKDAVKVEHQNNVSETDDDGDNVTSQNSKAAENTSSAVQKTQKNKKPKSKKNKRKKSQNEQLTSVERETINKLMKELITNEVRRSSKNKLLMSQQSCENNSRIHRTSQGESVESCNGQEDTIEIDCRKTRNILNGVGVTDYSDSVQSLTDNGESLPCSAYSDYHSEDSCSDSGKGGSDIQCTVEAFNGNDECTLSYTFEVPQDLCGALIGKHGRLINSIQDDSNTKIFVRENFVYSATKLCTIEGTQLGIKKALHLIRRRFPTQYFPNLTLTQLIFQPDQVAVPEVMQLRLPEGVACEVVLSSMLNPGHIFLQQPTHPTYPSLANLVHDMTEWYSEIDAPGIENPQEGNLCAVPGVRGWYRAKVTNVFSDIQECQVMYVDFGGFSRVTFSHLRQIKSNFFAFPPFQAQECFMANIQPAPADGVENGCWSAESGQIFEELAVGAVLQAYIVGYCGTIPLIQLFRTDSGFPTIIINDELVRRRAAQWFQHEPLQ